MSDRVILCGTAGVVRVSVDLMRLGAESLRQRLGWEVEVVEDTPCLDTPCLDTPCEKIGKAAACGAVDRVVIVPCGLGSLQLSEIRGAAWFSRFQQGSGERQKLPRIYIAEPLTEREIGRWLAQGVCGIDHPNNPQIKNPQKNNPGSSDQHSSEARHRRAKRIVLHEGLGVQEMESIALVAFWGNRLAPGVLECARECVGPGEPVRSRESAHEDNDGVPASLGQVPASLETASCDLGSTQVQLPWELSICELSGEDFGTWLMQRVLAGVRSRPLGWEACEDMVWPLLCGLHDQLSRDLPSEYVENLDSVSPRSMGSAVIAPDETGLVPWDKIWTSFCDLAMAGGPPHRGRLLEPVSIEEIRAGIDAYAGVEREIRRGIGLASGLHTVDSPYLGWVGVECQSEEMAAWLLRAILVENISVRREKSRLYLPAGPNYRLEKEIKNVITAVAKTTHYWQAHLRSRQPPKPL